MVCDEVIVLKGKTRLTCAELSGSVIIRTRQGETDLSLVKLNLGYSLKKEDFVDVCRIVRASLSKDKGSRNGSMLGEVKFEVIRRNWFMKIMLDE